MEFQNFVIFRDWFTLVFKDKTIQAKYVKNKYILWRMMFTLVSFFISFFVLLSINLWMMYNDKTKDVKIGDLVFNAVLGGLCLIFMLLVAYWKTKYWVLNMICSLFMNYTHYVVFESIKLTSFIKNQNPVGVFVITIIEFCTKGLYLFFVDDNFVYNLFCYFAFLPLYLGKFVNLYEKQDNEIGFFIIIFSFLAIGIYFIERIFKINYFGNETYDQEIIRNRNLVDNMKSAFVMFNLDTCNVTYNKIMKNKFIPKLLTGVSVPDQNLSIFKKEEEPNYDDPAFELNYQGGGNNSSSMKLNPKARDSTMMLMGIEEDPHENEKQCNIIKNILFTRLDRVNAHEFEGELKKASDEINQKIQASTTKTKKYIFFNQKTAKSSNKKSNKVNDEEENKELDEKSDNRTDKPLIKDNDFRLLFDNDFENLINILLNFQEILKEFKYLGTKRIKQEHDVEFIAQIFVRYYEHGRNLEFVLTESTSRGAQVTAESLAKGLLTRIPPLDNNQAQLVKGGAKSSGRFTTNFMNKVNTSIKHPMKEISVKMREALDLLDNPEENIGDIREILYYADNLSGLANYALEDLKYMNKPRNKKINVEKEKIDLPTLLENVIDLSKAKLKFKNKNINISYDIGQNVDDNIISDGKKITHILLNLIQNSIDASTYGNIQIFVESRSKRRDMVCFNVIDQGNQIKKDIRDYYNKTIPEDFEKVTGLVICKQLVDAIGRDLKLEPNGNQGTKASFFVKAFEVEVLNEDPQMTTDLSEEDADPINFGVGKEMMTTGEYLGKNIDANLLKRKIVENEQKTRFSAILGRDVVDTCDLRIIFADEDPALRAVFRNHIETYAKSEKLTLDIIECKDGADVLYSLYTHFEENRYVDALLFDENMNFITGAVLVEIIGILFKRSVIPDIRVFMATEYEMNASQYKFLKHLTKPIDYNTIKKNFQSLLPTPTPK